MIKNYIFLIAFVTSCLFVTAQEWTLRYSEENPSGYTHFAEGFIDEEGVVFLVGQEGPDRDTANAIILRIEPDGRPSSLHYAKEGFHSKASGIVEMPDHHLLVAGNLYNETGDKLMVLILDKDLNLLEERQYDKEVPAKSFGQCKCILDNHGHVIVSSYIARENEYSGTYYRGVFYKLNHLGDTICHRYITDDSFSPVYYLMDFRMRQMWYRNNNETLLCLAPGYGGILSFITFDSSFNYIDEHPIWRDELEKSDHTLSRDCYTDHWYSDNEALFFSSRGDANHNKLRVSKVNTQGEILEFIHLNERADTIDDAAQVRCMATSNDSAFYFSFHYHHWAYYPGYACVYLLNDRLEIIGSYVDESHDSFRTCLILPTNDGGCITVNDSCAFSPYTTTALPVIKKLSLDDFIKIPYFISHKDSIPRQDFAFPNPCKKILHIPTSNWGYTEKKRCRVENLHGQILMDCIVQPGGGMLNLDVSQLKAGVYQYHIYSGLKTLHTAKFIKK